MNICLMTEIVFALQFLAVWFFLLAVGCIFSDYVMPRIQVLNKWFETLPDWDEKKEN